MRDDDEQPEDDLHSSDGADDIEDLAAPSSGESGVVEGLPGDIEDLTADSGGADDAAPSQRRRTMTPGLVLLGLAASMWAAVGVMRCDGDGPEAPTLSVTDDQAAQSEELPEPETPPSAELPADPEPEPAAAADVDAEPVEAEEPPPEEEQLPPAAEVPARPSEGESWAASAKAPGVIRYTVRHGGSIKNVANLFKIYHHEITALNPGVGLDQELPAKSPVVVYKAKADTTSESVGFPSAGSLEGGVPMVEGPGRVLKAIPWKSWGTARTVATLDAVLRQWSKRSPKPQPVLVGNMAARQGGRLPPHSTHQSGRDVDLGYLQKLPKGEELNWREMTERNLDSAETWALLQLLAASGQVEVIYIDRSIQKLLHEYAKSHRLMSDASLREWMEYPKPTGSGNPLIQHVKGHIDHLHVRFKCQPEEDRCKSR